MTSGQVVALLDSMGNDQLMYEIFVSQKATPGTADRPLIGFTEDMNARQYMLIIEESV